MPRAHPASGTNSTLTDSVGPLVGSAKVTCDNGTATVTDGTCAVSTRSGCTGGAVTWTGSDGASCNGTRSTGSDGANVAVSNTATGTTGSAFFTCDDGTWTAGSSSCTSSAPAAVDGVCGSANGHNQTNAPGKNAACSSGTLGWIDQAGTDGAFNWKCFGSNGGKNATCSAGNLGGGSGAVNGLCGSANGASYTSAPPSSNACSGGTLSWTDNAGTDGNYNWQCVGSNGGSTATCSAVKTSGGGSGTPSGVTGLCGSGNGMVDLTSQPSGTAACAAGTFTDTADSDKFFNWSCTGSGGGGSASCSAGIKQAAGADCPNAYRTPVVWYGTRGEECCSGKPVPSPADFDHHNMLDGGISITIAHTPGQGSIKWTCTNGKVSSTSTCTRDSSDFCWCVAGQPCSIVE